MKRLILLAALASAACGQQPAVEPEAAPLGLMEQAAQLDEAQASVLAWQQVSANTTLDPPCQAVRNVADKGVVPDNAAADSIYAAYVGARAFTVQCGEQRTTVRANPAERWLVVMRPGAMSAEFVNCAGESGVDRCYGDIPLATADAAEAAGEAAKAP